MFFSFFFSEDRYTHFPFSSDHIPVPLCKCFSPTVPSQIRKPYWINVSEWVVCESEHVYSDRVCLNIDTVYQPCVPVCIHEHCFCSSKSVFPQTPEARRLYLSPVWLSLSVLSVRKGRSEGRSAMQLWRHQQRSVRLSDPESSSPDSCDTLNKYSHLSLSLIHTRTPSPSVLTGECAPLQNIRCADE